MDKGDYSVFSICISVFHAVVLNYSTEIDVLFQKYTIKMKGTVSLIKSYMIYYSTMNNIRPDAFGLPLFYDNVIPMDTMDTIYCSPAWSI